MKCIILLLGAPNDEQGYLSQIALDRINCALTLYNANKDICFLCTGGFGEQFNTTVYPHAHYTKQELIKRGVKEENFIEFILSSNTVEDFRLAEPILQKEEFDLLLIITSDFHIERVKILYHLIINEPNVLFIPAKSSLSEKELLPLILHEKEAINKLAANNYILY